MFILAFIALTPWLSKRYSAKWIYYAWLIIVAGLIIPFRFHSDTTFIQINTTAPAFVEQAVTEHSPSIAEPAIQTDAVRQKSPVRPWYQYLGGLWIMGAIVFIVYHNVRHYRFIQMMNRWGDQVNDPQILEMLQKIKSDMNIARQVRLQISPCVFSPMMIGFFNPVIVLPKVNFEANELSYILKHELIHLKRKDIWYKSLVFLATAIHWFNPIICLMAKAIARQSEMSCDAEVVAQTGMDERQHYSETIIGIIKHQSKAQTIFSTSFYGGKKDMKKRIFFIMDSTKKKAGIIILCLILIGTVTTGVVFALNENTPKKAGEDANAMIPGDDPTHVGIDTATPAPDGVNTAAPDGGAADGETDKNMIVHYADLTHDGTDEKIIIDLTYVDTLATGEEQTVCVYNGDTLIWSTHADTVHVGWNGVYLYRGNDGYYLMQWKPYGCTGLYHFTYEVFSLSDSGTEITLDSQEIEFEWKDADTDPEGLTQKITEFCNSVNEYLSSSILLIDTDGGAVAYSTADNQMTRQYDSSALLGELGVE